MKIKSAFPSWFFFGGGVTITVLCNIGEQIKFKYGIYAS